MEGLTTARQLTGWQMAWVFGKTTSGSEGGVQNVTAGLRLAGTVGPDFWPRAQNAPAERDPAGVIG